MFLINKLSTLLILLLLLLTGCSGDKNEPVINITESPANGLTELDMDSGYLRQLEKKTLDEANQRLAEAYKRNNVPVNERTSHARVAGRLIELGGKKLAVIDLTYSENRVWVSRITGVKEMTRYTISCISPAGRPVEVADPEDACGDAVHRTLIR